MRFGRLVGVAAGVAAAAATVACGKKGGDGAGAAASGSGSAAASGSAAGSAAPAHGGSAAAPDWASAGSAAAGAIPAGGSGQGSGAAASGDAGSAAAALALARVGAGDLPAGVASQAHLDAAWRFTDAAGVNYVLFSSKPLTGPSRGPDGEPTRGKAIYVDDWLVPPGGAPKRLRVVRDRVEDCPLDVTAAFHPDALEVTDLDRDGTGELWFAYEVGCRSDVSPDTYKLLALEGGDKYILRGRTLIDDGSGQTFGGDYDVDPSFTKGPPAFLTYARALWIRTAADLTVGPRPH